MGFNSLCPKPIAHEHAIPFPLVTYDIQDLLVLGSGMSVLQKLVDCNLYSRDATHDAVIRGHDRRRFGLFHYDLKGAEIHLAQGLLVDDGIVEPPLGLRVVADEVFRANGYALALDTYKHNI